MRTPRLPAPVRVAPWAGWAALAAGAVLSVLGWYGVSGERFAERQLPYLASGTVPGAAAASSACWPWPARCCRPLGCCCSTSRSKGMAPATAERTYALLGSATATGRTVVVAEQALPPGLRAVTAVVYELRRGTVVFCGEPSERPDGGGTTGSAAALRH
ncbi:hypothetical protein [Streptomyces meridianus]|uniref:Uncharacterized protein n=1 Tax=Streptomyces meridianus TaxID=2938945 RepID=A0ABT0X1Z5_9ACTN|nr:hypothetical protein [Streptomyces meridianus]MCM2576571.1 hypothetical protein [Streptomyces meridianus]